jgi:hypothetical protein
MEHFASEDWADFVRKAGSKETQQAMEEHLKSGCETCRAALHFWSKAIRMASREGSYAPPTNVVRTAKAMRGLLNLARPTHSRMVALADLILDSSLPTAAAGVRSSGTGPWLLLYRCGSVNIDLRVDQIPASGRISIVGQVLNSSKTSQMLANIPVAAVFEDGRIQKTTTNKLGEFHLECEAVSQLYLSMHLDKRMEIWVPLNRSKDEHLQGARF